MDVPLTTYLSPTKTTADWLAVRKRLHEEAPLALWCEVVRTFFHDRVHARYLRPIEVIQRARIQQGEGFSIVTIQCALIEFLESTMQGVAYRYLRRGEALRPYEYSKSRDLFCSFLTTRLPFSTVFSSAVAEDFYAGVRCGLLHEAQTKNGWHIRASRSKLHSELIDVANRLIFRDNFQHALRVVIDAYETSVVQHQALKAAFIRKFDRLATD